MRKFIYLIVMLFYISGIFAQEPVDFYKDPWDMRSDMVNIDSLNYYCDIVDAHNKRLESILPTMTKDDIAKLIDKADYMIDDKTFEKVGFYVMPALMRWSAGVPDDKLYEDDGQVFDRLESVGLEPIYTGEGYSDIECNIQFYLDMLKPYADVQSVEYLTICNSFSGVIIMDAGLVIPLRNLLERCIRVENYLVKFPQSAHRYSILSYYYDYMRELMFCIEPNTMTFDRDTDIIEDHVYEEFLSLSTLYPETQTCQILQAYINGLKANGMKYSKVFDDDIMSRLLLGEYKKMAGIE